MRWLVILVAALSLVVAGCGGGDDSTAASDETTIEETTTATDESTEESTTDESTAGDTDLSGIIADEDCLALGSVGASIAQAFGGAVDSGEQADLDELASKVPEEIRADVQTLAQALAAYSAKIEDIGIEAGATPTAAQLQELQAAITSLDQQELTAASNRLEAWSKENCTG